MDPIERYARCSRAAYRDLGPLAPRCAELGLDVLGEVDQLETDTHGYAACDGRVLVLGFEGTKDLENALRDAEVNLDTFQPLRLASLPYLVHAGFLGAWKSVRDWCQTIIDTTPEAGCVVVTGHSLGGAIATLAATDLLSSKPIVAYTYGSPRVGVERFARAYDQSGITTTRVVHDEDLVPRVPWNPYDHVAGELRLADDGTHIGPVRSFFRRLLNDLDGGALRDHHVDRYVTTCARYAARAAAAESAAPIS